MAARSAEILKSSNDFVSNPHQSSRNAFGFDHRPVFNSFDRSAFDKRRPFDLKSNNSSFRRPLQNSLHHFNGPSSAPHSAHSSQMFSCSVPLSTSLNFHSHSLPVALPLNARRRFAKSESLDTGNRDVNQNFKSSLLDEKTKMADNVDSDLKKDDQCLADNVFNENQNSSNHSDQIALDKSQSSSSSLDKKRNKQLVRSEAVCDDRSPSPAHSDILQTKGDKQIKSNPDISDSKSDDQSLKNSGEETYTDFNGTDLQKFLIHTLQNNVRERVHLLKIEQDLINLIKETDRHSYRFPPMSSYHRMFVHRVAAYFGFEHNIDETGSSVVVIKQKGITRIPDTRFRHHINNSTYSLDEPKKLILKRDTASFDDFKQQTDRRGSGMASYSDLRKCKSFEEREEQYVKARARIFNQSQQVVEQHLDSVDSCDTRIPHQCSATDAVQGTPQRDANCYLNLSNKCNKNDCTKNTASSLLDTSKKMPNSLSGSNTNRQRQDAYSTSNSNNSSHSNLSNNSIHSNHSIQMNTSDNRHRNQASNHKRFYPKAGSVVNNHTSNNSASLLPYPVDVNNQMRTYPLPYPMAPYVDYSHGWFTGLPSIAPPEVLPNAAAPPIYAPPYIGSNADFYSNQTVNRSDKFKNAAYSQPNPAYYSYAPPEMQLTDKNNGSANSNAYGLAVQLSSMCLNPNVATSTSATSNSVNSHGYVMPEQIGSSVVPYFYLPANYSNSVTSGANVPPEFLYSNMLGYQHSHHSSHQHSHVSQPISAPPSAQIIMIPGIGSSNVNTLNGYKPIVPGTMIASGVSNPAVNPIDSYIKFNPYSTFPSMQNHTSHLNFSSPRVPMNTNKGFKPQQSPLLPTPQQQSQNVPTTSYCNTKPSDGNKKSTNVNCNGYNVPFNRKEQSTLNVCNGSNNATNANYGGSSGSISNLPSMTGSDSNHLSGSKFNTGKAKRTESMTSDYCRNGKISDSNRPLTKRPVTSNQGVDVNKGNTNVHHIRTNRHNKTDPSISSSTCAYRSLPVENSSPFTVDTFTG